MIFVDVILASTAFLRAEFEQPLHYPRTALNHLQMRIQREAAPRKGTLTG